MKRHVIILSIFMLTLGFTSTAQNNLDVTFQTIPDFLNICGDTDQEVVTVAVAGASSEVRSNISATIHFFQGVELVNFDAMGSSPGITLVDASDPSNPIFSLPDLDPAGTSSIDVSLEVRARCGYIDTLQGGTGIFDVIDEWEFDYDLGPAVGQNETNATALYRDALAFPILNLDVDNTFGPAKLGDCFSRDVIIQNSGLAGFVDSLVYENIQGAGVYVTDVLVNGVPIAFSKSVQGVDTVITFGIGAAEFMAMAGGDADGFFDPNETIIVQEDLCLVDCLGDRASSHNVSWGCDTRFCETVTAADFVAVGQGAADVQVYENGTIPDQDAGYCQVGNSTLIFTNEGIEIDAGFATMLDVSAGISLAFVGDMGLMSDNGFDITEMYIGTVQITTPDFLIDLDNNPLFFMNDPDGPGGLSDFDGDNYYDDLELNESVEVTVYYTFDCGLASGPDENCENDFTTNFSGLVNFTNLCGDRLERFNLNYKSITHKKTEEIYESDPDAFMVTDTFFLHHQQKRRVDGFARNCSDMEEYRVQVVLPPGINLIPGATVFNIENNVPLTMISNVVSNDTLYLAFHASPVGVDDIPLLHDIFLAFEATCGAIVGPTIFPTQLSHYCPDCDCEHVWHCEEFVGPAIHTTNPPCPPLVCPIGVQSTDFNVERTTFGFGDTNYTIPIDPLIVNRKAALACDTVEMSILNIIGDTPLTDSIGMVITYNNPDGSTSADESFLFAQGNLEITQGATVTNCPIDPSHLTVTSVDSTKTLNFDLNHCLIDNGITLMPGDEINFVGKFTVNPNAPLETSTFSDVPNLRGYGYALVDGVEYACDNYGDVFTLGSLLTSTAYPNASTQIRGCQEVTLNVQVITQLNGYADVFGFEHRPVIMVDSLVINYDPTILESFGSFQPSLIMPDHPFYGDNPIPMPPIESFTPGRYVVYLDTLAWGPSILSASATYPFNFSIRAIPNCQTDFGNAGGGNIYPFNPGISFYEYAYARAYGDGSCSNYIEEQTVGQNIQYGNPPEMNFIPVTSPTFTLLEDTASWTVQYCNITNDADIGHSWLAIEDALGVIDVVSMTDISLPMSPVDLTFNNYGAVGNNFLTYTDGLLRSDGANGLEEVCNTVLIKATVNQCGTFDFLAKSGWDCLAPTDVNWTPDDYDPCVDSEIPMTVIVREPFIDADIEQEPLATAELCEENEVIIRIKNTTQGTLYDLATSIITPEGINLVNGSFEIAYPASAAFTPIAVDPVANGSNALGDIFTYNDFSDLDAYLDQNGLRGVNAAMPNDSNELLLRFAFNTDCDFLAGSRIYYSLVGIKGCGVASNTETGETLPLTVVGLPGPADNSFDIDFVMGTGLVPGEQSTVGISVTNTNANATDADDYIRLELPSNVMYQLGSAAGVQPMGWIPGDPVQEVNGANIIYTWQLPIGLAQNEIAILNFDVSSPDYDCSQSSLPVNLNTFVRTVVTCQSTMMDCTIETLTSSNNGATTDLNILQQTLQLVNITYTSSCQDASSEFVTVSGSLYNPGDPIAAATININYYFDDDGNGTLDGTEPFLTSTTATGPIGSMAAVSFENSFAVTLAELCGIIAQVDTTGLNLCGADEYPLGNPQLINAGDDQLHCSVDPTTITSTLGDANCAGLAGYSFDWIAIAPASTGELSATNVANPTLTIDHDGIVEDTLQYILTTTRPGCGSTLTTSDTIDVIRGLGLILNVTTPVTTNAGVPVGIGVNASNGTMPYTYNWTPATGLDDPSSANPTATVNATTTFQVEVTSATGCMEIAQVEVIVDNCIDPVANSLILTQTNCGAANGSAVIHLAQDEANYTFTWTPDIGDPNAVGNVRNNLPVGHYSVAVESIAASGACNSVVDLIISAYDGPQVDVVTTGASCTLADGTATLSPDTLAYEWSDTGSGATRNDLAAGTYYVTAYDAADVDCATVLTVNIDEINNLTATVVVNSHASDCTANDGSATITVAGGSGNYSYSWSSGTADNNNLSSGVFVVTITDQDAAACELEVIFAINGGGNLAQITVNSIQDILCAGPENGNIDYDVTITGMFTPVDTIITNGVDTFQNGALPGGEYCLLIVDATNCIGASHCFEIVESEDLQLVFTVTPPCPDNGAIELTIHGGTPGYSVDWADVDGTDDVEDRTGLSVGTYAALVTDTNGCFVNEDEIVLNTCSTICDFFFGETTYDSFVPECDEVATICLDINSDNIDQIVVSDNGVIYEGNYVGCNFDTSFSYVYTSVILNLPPPYRVVSWMVNGQDYSGDFDSFQSLTDSMNVWDENGNWILEAGANSIVGGAMSVNYGDLSIESQSGFSVPPITPLESIDALSLALEIEPGFHIIVVNDTINGCTDTLLATIDCPPYELQYNTLCLSDTESFVIDTSQLDLEGTVVTSANICTATGYVAFAYDPITFTLDYAAYAPGIDTACIEFITDTGVRDTMFFFITAEDCEAFFCDTVFVLQTKEYCLDPVNLAGPITTITDLCPESSGESVQVTWDVDAGCIEYEGIELGRDTACIQFCDDFGNCDTTYFCLETVPYLLPPDAIDDCEIDTDTIYSGEPTVINFKENDILFGGVDTAYIIDYPIYGTLGTSNNSNPLNLDCTVTYTADEDICERYDEFTYGVCNPIGCDTATVCIWIACSDIVIFTAVSPNGDGVNDFFHIGGIDKYPENELAIYNRWGNRVFETKGYNNEWNGDWNNKRQVPDGTYYYVLRLNDKDDRKFNGYFELYR